jgi:hypothetical protein
MLPFAELFRMVGDNIVRRYALLTKYTESVIDRIPHPELRDRMILLRGALVVPGSNLLALQPTFTLGRFDLVDCLMDYREAVTIHGDDVLAHSNWEIEEKWMRKYGSVAPSCHPSTR